METVGAGGSITLEETGVVDTLARKRQHCLFQQLLRKKHGNMDKEEAKKKSNELQMYYLSSTNALTLEGDLINIDAIGNRVAGMFYGPDKVVIVTGSNKLDRKPSHCYSPYKGYSLPLEHKKAGA